MEAFSQIDILKYLLSRLIKCNIRFLIHPLSVLTLQDNVVHQIPLYIIKPDRFNNSLSKSVHNIYVVQLKVIVKLKLCQIYHSIETYLQVEQLLNKKTVEQGF